MKMFDVEDAIRGSDDFFYLSSPISNMQRNLKLPSKCLRKISSMSLFFMYVCLYERARHSFFDFYRGTLFPIFYSVSFFQAWVIAYAGKDVDIQQAVDQDLHNHFKADHFSPFLAGMFLKSSEGAYHLMNYIEQRKELNAAFYQSLRDLYSPEKPCNYLDLTVYSWHPKEDNVTGVAHYRQAMTLNGYIVTLAECLENLEDLHGMDSTSLDFKLYQGEPDDSRDIARYRRNTKALWSLFNISGGGTELFFKDRKFKIAFDKQINNYFFDDNALLFGSMKNSEEFSESLLKTFLESENFLRYLESQKWLKKKLHKWLRNYFKQTEVLEKDYGHLIVPACRTLFPEEPAEAILRCAASVGEDPLKKHQLITFFIFEKFPFLINYFGKQEQLKKEIDRDLLEMDFVFRGSKMYDYMAGNPTFNPNLGNQFSFLAFSIPHLLLAAAVPFIIGRYFFWCWGR